MSQATDTHSTLTSRRSALAGAVAAFASVPATVAFGASHPDAELFDLGRQLAALFDEFAAKRKLSDRAEAGWVPPELPATLKATADDLALIGHPETHGGYWSNWAIDQKLKLMRDKPQAMARLTELRRLVEGHEEAYLQSRVECGAEPANDRVTEVCEKIEAVSACIRTLPATTVQGVAVKALPLTFSTSLWDENPDDMDWDQFCIRGFATEVLRHLPDDIRCQRLTEALAEAA
jgi:hypothetical protein